jgi:inner membrane protein
MDPLTHALSGAVIRNFGFRRQAALWVLVAASLAPDLDLVAGFWGADVMLRHHRGITHGVLFLIAVPVLAGVLFRKRGGFLYYWFLATLGYGSHIALDLTDSYGTRLFAPLDWQRHAAGLTFMAEPLIILGLVVSLIIAGLKGNRARAVSFVTAALMVFYVGVKHHYHEKTEELLRASMDEYIIEEVSPLPNEFMRWWFIAHNGKKIKTGFADLFTDTIYIHKTYPMAKDSYLVERSKDFGVVKNFLYFAQYPYAEVSKNGKINVVKWRELSFGYSSRDRFTATLDMGEDGDLLDSRIRI